MKIPKLSIGQEQKPPIETMFELPFGPGKKGTKVPYLDNDGTAIVSRKKKGTKNPYFDNV